MPATQPMRIARRRSGFTIIELSIGLALSGLVFTGILMLLDQLADSRARFIHEADVENTVANGERILRTMIERAEAGGDSTERFVGDDRAATFVSWCDVPRGWPERCRVALILAPGTDTSTVQIALSSRDTVMVARIGGTSRLRYLNTSQSPPAWVVAWGTSIALPAAVAIVTERDTVILRAGGRQ
jgi:prepilin-type N-terminal cleavage/methylation domain-containing protein